MSQIVDSNFATKHDLKDLSSEVTAALKGEISGGRLEIKDSTIKTGKMLAAAVGIIITVVGLLIKL